jgi:hypothetical protein
VTASSLRLRQRPVAGVCRLGRARSALRWPHPRSVDGERLGTAVIGAEDDSRSDRHAVASAGSMRLGPWRPGRRGYGGDGDNTGDNASTPTPKTRVQPASSPAETPRNGLQITTGLAPVTRRSATSRLDNATAADRCRSERVERGVTPTFGVASMRGRRGVRAVSAVRRVLARLTAGGTE